MGASSIKAHLHFTVQIKVSLHVFVHGLGGPVGVGDQGEDGAHGDDGGLRDAGPGIFFFLSVFIHSVGF